MTTVLKDIVAFIDKRLDEDWTTAMDVPNQRWQDSAGFVQTWAGRVGPFQLTPEPVGDLRGMPGAARHAALHDPDRVLRAVDAKRRIVHLHTGAHECAVFDSNGERDGFYFVPDGDACSTLRLIAAEWSTHQDYREEWRQWT